MAKEDTNKVNILNHLFLQYEFENDEKAKAYLNQALVLSQKINYKKGLASTYIHLGFFAEDKGNYQDALNNYLTSLKIFEEIGDKKGVADSYLTIGNIYDDQGNYPEALKNYLACLEIRKTIGDKKGEAASICNIGNVYKEQGNYPEALKNIFSCLKVMEAISAENPRDIENKKNEATAYNNLGNVFYVQGNYTEALKNHFASLKIIEAIGDKQGLATCYNNIGNVYSNQGNYSMALEYYFDCLKIKQAIGDKEGIAIAYNNIGLIYLYQGSNSKVSPSERKQSLDSALINFQISLQIKKTIGDKAGMASSSIGIGNVFMELKQYKKAEEYLIEAKALSMEIGAKKYLRDAYARLSELDSATGNFKGAYVNHKLHILYRDSIDNEETRKKTIQTQMTYDFEKKEAVANAEHKKELENQASLADEKSRKQEIILLFVVGGLLLVVVFAGFILRALRVTRKQKNIIELQKKIVEEHQKEILDSIHYARRIQQSLLPTEKYIGKSLSRLKIMNDT